MHTGPVEPILATQHPPLRTHVGLALLVWHAVAQQLNAFELRKPPAMLTSMPEGLEAGKAEWRGVSIKPTWHEETYGNNLMTLISASYDLGLTGIACRTCHGHCSNFPSRSSGLNPKCLDSCNVHMFPSEQSGNSCRSRNWTARQHDSAFACWKSSGP